MKHRLSVFLAAVAFFNTVKSDVNIAKIFESEKKHFKKEHKEILNDIEKIFKNIFQIYDNASDDQKKLDLYIDYPFTYSFSYSFGSEKYQHEILLGVKYNYLKKLSEEEKAQLIEYAKNAINDLLDKEVFGIRSISENIMIYFVITKIEKISEIEKISDK